MPNSSFFQRKIIEPLKAVAKQGASPMQMALAASLGFAIGLCPIWGLTTSLCVLVGLGFGLNQILLQVGNYLAYPLQLILILPYLQGGQLLFSENQQAISLAQIEAAYAQGLSFLLKSFGWLLLYGGLLWLISFPLIVLLSYYPLQLLLKKWVR